jgi:GntR family L-lactate dehydrogenase operon transcriptional regulator
VDKIFLSIHFEIVKNHRLIPVESIFCIDLYRVIHKYFISNAPSKCFRTVIYIEINFPQRVGKQPLPLYNQLNGITNIEGNMKRNTLSDQIAAQLEAMITDGALHPGERLPAERTLAERLGVSRPSLREAIKKLASRGLLHSRQGGGTYVMDSLDKGMTDPILELLQQHPESRFDVLEVRHALDGQAAYYAALRATAQDRDNIQRHFDRMIELHIKGDDPMAEALADAAFHLSITEASHNVVMLHVMRSLFSVLQKTIKHNLDKLYTIPRVFEPLSTQHERLMRTVIDGDPVAAREAAQEHLVFVEESLQGIDQEQARHERFLRQASILKPQDLRS